MRSMTLTLRELQDEAHDVARAKGWYSGPYSVRHMLERLDDELKDAIIDAPADANLLTLNTDLGHQDEFPSELADMLIRIADIAQYLHIDLETVVKNRLARMRS